MRGRKSIIFIAMIAFALVATACSQATATPERVIVTEVITQIVEGEPVEVEVTRVVEVPVEVTAEISPEEVSLTVWYLSQSPEEIALMQDMAARFEEEHPGVTVEFSPYSFADMNNTLRLALDGGVGPDVAYASPGASHGSAYAAAGHLMDLTPYAEELGWTDRISPGVLGYWNEDPNTYFQVPFDLVTVGVYYNTEIFDQLGLSEPTTFEEFETILATIKDAGITPISIGGLDGWPLAHVWEQLVHTSVPIEDIEALELGDPSVAYNRPEIVAAAEKVNEWHDLGYFQDNMLATAYADGNNLFITGEAAINIGGTWNNSTFTEQPDFEVGFFGMPQIDPSLDWHMGGFTPNNAWMVPVYSPHRDLAIEYVDFMLGEDTATAMWNGGLIPAYGFATIPDPVSFLQTGVYDAMQTAGPGYYLGNVDPEVQQQIWNNLQSMVAGEVTPEEAMNNVQEVYETFAGAG